MAQTLFTITEADLDRLERIARQLADLQDMLGKVVMSPRPEWVTVDEYAAEIGKSKRTVLRYIETGNLETKQECGTLLIKAPR